MPRTPTYGTLSHLIFDLETTGLDPRIARIRSIGALAPQEGELTLICSLGDLFADERRLLRQALLLLEEPKVLVGWNITEFDLPFLSERCRRHGISFPVEVSSERGKYGGPRATLKDRLVRDLAYEAESLCQLRDVEWGLHSLARSYGWHPMTSLTGADMPEAALAEVAQHCLDDLTAVDFLLRLPEFNVVEPA